MDDHGHIAARWRLLGHFAAASWLLFWMGGLPVVEFGGVTFDLGWFGHVLAAFYLVWLLNLYNFMDGIDGIASVEAICVCLGACLLVLGEWCAATWSGRRCCWPCAVAVFCSGISRPRGFSWGMPAAGFWVLCLGGCRFRPHGSRASLLWGWLILLGVFIVDATFTLFRRLLGATRSMKHIAVTPISLPLVGLAAICRSLWPSARSICFWLLPIACGVTRLGWTAAWALIVAYAPLVVLAIKFRAGELEKPADEELSNSSVIWV